MTQIELDLKYSVRLAESGAAPRRLIISPQLNLESNDESRVPADKLMRAAEWALDLDAQYRDLLQAGRSLQVIVPSTLRWSLRRAECETAAGYRILRLKVGELLYPLLLDPPELGKLYPFQFQGVQWLTSRTRGILADDMGLGKTVQAITAMRLLFNCGQLRNALVICPKSLIATWEREFDRWAPELGIAVLTPPSRIRENAWKAVAGHRHVILTNYEQLRKIPEILRKTPPDLIVADEVHRLRNRHAQVTAGSFQLEPKQFWGLSGTPLERDIEDLVTLLSLVAPKHFSPNDTKLHPSSLRSRARPYILRRRKQDVLEELPAVLDTTEVLELSGAQERAYSAAVRLHRRAGEKGNELALLTRLMALCDIDTKSRESCKLERILQLLERIYEQQEKAVVFSYRLEPLRELKRRIVDQSGPHTAVLLVGEMSSEERDRAITHFRNYKQSITLLASSRVGSEGLTLVEANHVFLLNQWWNPSANDQARDRVVRIGQRRKVHIHRFCCRGTIEEALERILESKQELFKDTIERMAYDEESTWAGVLRETGIDDLLSAADS